MGGSHPAYNTSVSHHLITTTTATINMIGARLGQSLATTPRILHRHNGFNTSAINVLFLWQYINAVNTPAQTPPLSLSLSHSSFNSLLLPTFKN